MGLVMSNMKSALGLTLNIERKVKVIISTLKPYTHICVCTYICNGDPQTAHTLLAKGKLHFLPFV